MRKEGRTDTMKEYELMFIVPTSFTEDELGTVEKNVTALLEKNGASVKKTVRLGKLRFAYPIRHEQYGHYVLMRFLAETSTSAAINEGLRLNQKEVLRYVVIDGDDASETYKLVQYQEVHVDGSDRRRRPSEEGKSEGKEKDEKEQKEGVAAIEGTTEKEGEAVHTGLEKLSEEDLQKKIEAALKEEAA